MSVEWFILLCLLSVPIHVAANLNATHPISTRAADDSLDALSQDLLHFAIISVQINVQDKMRMGPLDLQTLADRISDLGVSFRQMEEAKVAELEAQLTAIGTGIETECSTGCEASSEIIDGFGLIETIKASEAVIQAADDATGDVFSGGPVVSIQNAVNMLNDYVPKTKWDEISKFLNNLVTAATALAPNEALSSKSSSELTKLRFHFGSLSELRDILDKALNASKWIDEGVKSQVAVLKNIESVAAISLQLKSENSKMVSFQQTSTSFSATLDKINTLIQQNQPKQVLTELKTLENLNIGSKFLNYFDNSFTASKWLTKLLTRNENQNLDKLKDNLKDLKSVGERLDPLRTSVENVNSLQTHQALLDIASLLQQTNSLFPDLSKATSELPGCVQGFDLSADFTANVQATINSLDQAKTNVKDFETTLEAFVNAQKSNFHVIKNFIDSKDSEIVEKLKKKTEVDKATDALKAIKTGIPTVKTDDVKTWLQSTNIGTVMTDTKTWISKSNIVTSLKCLKDNNVIDPINAKLGGLQNIGKLAKSDANTAVAIQASKDLKTAIDIWKQLAAAPTRRRRQSESTIMDELIVSTLAVRRLIRACSTGTLATLLQGVPQLDAKVKKFFEEALKSCQVLRDQKDSVEKLSGLSNVLLALNPLSDTHIDTVKLADELAPTVNHPAVQQALQDLKQIDLKFAKHQSEKVSNALDGLEVHFAHLLGSGRQVSTDEPDGCVGEDCEESSTSWGTIAGIVAGCVVVLGGLGGGGYYMYRKKMAAKKEDKKDDEKKDDDKKDDKKKNDKKKDGKKKTSNEEKKSGTDSKTNSKGEEKSEEPKIPDGKEPEPEKPKEEPVKVVEAKAVEEPPKKESTVDPKEYQEAKERKKREQELINEKLRANVVDGGRMRIPSCWTAEMLKDGLARAREYDAQMDRPENRVEFSPAKHLSGDLLPLINRYKCGPEYDIVVNVNKEKSERVQKTQRSSRTPSQERSSAGGEKPTSSAAFYLDDDDDDDDDDDFTEEELAALKARYDKYEQIAQDFKRKKADGRLSAGLDIPEGINVPANIAELLEKWSKIEEELEGKEPEHEDTVLDRSFPTVWISGDGWTDEQIAGMQEVAHVRRSDGN